MPSLLAPPLHVRLLQDGPHPPVARETFPRVLCVLHEKEWGRASNTGTVLRGTLGDERCEVVMRGLPEHDERIEAAMRDPEVTAAILWPGEGAVDVREIQKRAERETGEACVRCEGAADGREGGEVGEGTQGRMVRVRQRKREVR